MNDPHVKWLLYRLELGPSLTIAEGASAREGETDAFSYSLDAGKLKVTMKEHYASPESALTTVQPFVRSWELDIALTYGPDVWRFVYEHPEVIDRNPPPPGSSRTIAPATGVVRATSLDFHGSS